MTRKIAKRSTFFDGPSYNPSQSYLDCSITNLVINDLSNGKIKTAEYDSDHKALIFSVQLVSNIHFEKKPDKFNFKATKWDRFTKNLDDTFTSILQEDKNLSIEEIDEYIESVSKSIIDTINISVPKFKKQDSFLKYLNSRIKKLHKNKSELISKLHRLRKHQPLHYQQEIAKTKHTIKLVKDELKKELNKSITSYWNCQLKQINRRDPAAFFPKINRMLRQRSSIEIANQTIDTNSKLITPETIKHSTPISNLDNNTITITNPVDKLNVIGDHYKNINSPRYLNIDTPLKKIIDKTVNDLESKLDEVKKSGKTFTEFSPTNQSESI